MPKVYLTADQRLAARYDAMAQRLADGLAVYKCRNRLRNRLPAFGRRPHRPPEHGNPVQAGRHGKGGELP